MTFRDVLSVPPIASNSSVAILPRASNGYSPLAQLQLFEDNLGDSLPTMELWVGTVGLLGYLHYRYGFETMLFY